MRSSAHRRGQALLIVLLLLVVVAGLTAVMLKEVRGVLDAVDLDHDRQEAQYAAESGVEYALQDLNRRNWMESDSAWTLDSREQGVIGYQVPQRYFIVEVSRAPEPATERRELAQTPLWQVVSTGVTGGVRRVIRTQFADAADLTRSLWNVTSFDYDTHSFRSAQVVFGAERSAVRGFIEQLAVVPEHGTLPLASAADRHFAGVRPETVVALDAEGNRVPPVSVTANAIAFPRRLARQPVTVFHDYLHRVPLPPGPFHLALPYNQVQAGTTLVREPLGLPFRQDLLFPRLQSHFSLLTDRGHLFFTEHDSSRPLQIDYAFHGHRATGPIHVNADLRWQGRNLLYLMGQRRDTVTATGTITASTPGRVFVTTESAITRLDQEPSETVRARESYRLPVPVDWHFYRRRADASRGGDGLYLANEEDRENAAEARAEWKRESLRHWNGIRYEPPGVVLDLSTIAPPDGLVFAEGNVRLRGQPPNGSRWTIVSAGSIYLESDLNLSDSTSLACVARDSVVVNATQLDPNAPTTLRVLVVAVRGTFGMVAAPSLPAGGARFNHLLFLGAITENEHTDPGDWARAFGTQEWVYDARYRRPPLRPLWLAGRLFREWDWTDHLD